MDTSELELELKVKDKELTSVREDVERLQKNLLTLRDKSTNQIELLEKELREKGRRLTETEKLLSQQEDYEEIKKELKLIEIHLFIYLFIYLFVCLFIQYYEKCRVFKFISRSHTHCKSHDNHMIYSLLSQTSVKPLEVLLLEKNRG